MKKNSSSLIISKQQGKTKLELSSESTKKLKGFLLILIKDVNNVVKLLTYIDANKTYNTTYSKDFTKDISCFLDDYEVVLNALMDSLNEINSEKRETLRRTYHRLALLKHNVSETEECILELLKEEMYISSLLSRSVFIYENAFEKIQRINSLIFSIHKKSFNSTFNELKSLLVDLMALSIYDNGLKRVVNDIVSYRVQNINGRFILTLR